MSFYVGIDLNDAYAVASYYELNNEEPETVSSVAGSEIYQIPLVLAKKKHLSQWYYGDEAKRLARSGDFICVDQLLTRALQSDTIGIEEETFQGEELLSLFLKKVIALTQMLGNPRRIDKLVLTLPKLEAKYLDLFNEMLPNLGIERENFSIIDYKESFYYFVLNQKPDFFLHDVQLFDCKGQNLSFYTLKRNLHTSPQVITLEESKKYTLEADKDEAFTQVLSKAFEGKIVSTCYLTGDGFDGNWMHDSLNVLCRGKRAFLGKNLYSKGAAYAGAVLSNKKEWNYVYLGEYEMKFNLSLKVSNVKQTEFFDLITAGTNWFDAKKECDILLQEGKEIVFWKQSPHSNEAKVESLELTDLPNRPDRTTRLHIVAIPVSDKSVELQIMDLGFGDLFKSSGKIWKYTMNL